MPVVNHMRSIPRLKQLFMPGILCFVLTILVNTVEGQQNKKSPGVQTFTVANLRPDSTFTTVIFLESARMYKLMKNNPCYNKYLRILTTAVKNKKKLKVTMTDRDSDVIKTVME